MLCLDSRLKLKFQKVMWKELFHSYIYSAHFNWNHYIKIPHTRNACNVMLRASDICPALLVACWKERRWKIKSSSLMIKFKWTELGWVVQQNKWLLVVVNMDFPAHGLCVMTSNKIFIVQCSCYVNKNIFISSAPIGLVTNNFLEILLQFCIL